jgi:hypothetical protein
MVALVEEASGLCNVNSVSSGKSKLLQGKQWKTVSTICRVSIPQLNKKIRTHAARHSLNPIWNHMSVL